MNIFEAARIAHLDQLVDLMAIRFNWPADDAVLVRERGRLDLEAAIACWEAILRAHGEQL